MNFDHHFGDHINEGTYYRVRDGIFDARNVQEEGIPSDDVSMILCQSKVINSSSHKDAKTNYYCGKQGHTVRFVTLQRTRRKRMQITQKNLMTTYLQHNMKHIRRVCMQESWIIEQWNI